MNRSTIISTLALVLLGIQTWRLSNVPEPAHASSPSEKDIAALEDRLSALAARTDAVEQQAAIMRAPSVKAPVPATPSNAVPETSVGEAPPEADTQAEVAPLSQETRLDTVFAEEPMHDAWSETATDEAVDALADALPSGSAIHDVDCRRTLCRMEIGHTVPEGHDTFLQALTQGQVTWPGPGSVRRVETPGSDPVTLVYLGKPGSEQDENSPWL